MSKDSTQNICSVTIDSLNHRQLVSQIPVVAFLGGHGRCGLSLPRHRDKEIEIEAECVRVVLAFIADGIGLFAGSRQLMSI